MSNNKIKFAALALLSKSISPEQATSTLSASELHELEFLLKSMNKKTGDGRYGRPNPDVELSKDDPLTSGVTAGTAAGTMRSGGPSLDAGGVAGMAAAFGKQEVLKTDKNGQWKLDKAIKPGPALDYSKFNKKPDYAEIEAKAPTIDYGNKPTAKPKWSGAADKAAAVRAKIDAEANETAAETIARRQNKVLKEEGVNTEPELTADKQKRMVAKNEMMGYGTQPQSAPPEMMQSEKEPHADDPHHEEKEKKKAKKIKAEAEDLLDMHKADDPLAEEKKKKAKKIPEAQTREKREEGWITAQPTQSVKNLYGGYEGGHSMNEGKINPKVRG